MRPASPTMRAGRLVFLRVPLPVLLVAFNMIGWVLVAKIGGKIVSPPPRIRTQVAPCHRAPLRLASIAAAAMPPPFQFVLLYPSSLSHSQVILTGMGKWFNGLLVLVDNRGAAHHAATTPDSSHYTKGAPGTYTSRRGAAFQPRCREGRWNDCRRCAGVPRVRAVSPPRIELSSTLAARALRPPARAARVELSSILGGLTARSRGTPAHLRQSLHLPTLHLGWKAAPRRLV